MLLNKFIFCIAQVIFVKRKSNIILLNKNEIYLKKIVISHMPLCIYNINLYLDMNTL